MVRRILSVTAALTALAFLAPVDPARAQLGDLMKKAKEKAKQKVEEKATKPAEAKPAEKPATPADTAAAPASPAATEKPGEGVWLNYDFVPGDRVLYYEDFARDQVGNFPERLELIEGNMEVAEWKGSRWLRCSTDGVFSITLPEVLPPRFTVEFDYYAPWVWNSIDVWCGQPEETENPGLFTKAVFSTYDKKGGLKQVDGKTLAYGAFAAGTADNAVLHCRILADSKYMKVYANETRVANFPTANFGRTNRLRMRFVDTDEQRPAMVGNLRVAASDKRLYDALASAGRVATHGILFDSGSDRIRPESTPTLKEIGQMLKDHADLKLRIEGHTDDVGDDAGNQALSDKRATAVRGYLVAQYGIDEARLQAKGFGETKPVDKNDTAEGRQNNRRVELVKL
jgi:outer membrane protein OmpA-like peptidoglycan-associated protein